MQLWNWTKTKLSHLSSIRYLAQKGLLQCRPQISSGYLNSWHEIMLGCSYSKHLSLAFELST